MGEGVDIAAWNVAGGRPSVVNNSLAFKALPWKPLAERGVRGRHQSKFSNLYVGSGSVYKCPTLTKAVSCSLVRELTTIFQTRFIYTAYLSFVYA